MKIWKVILATVVIFAAGMFAGGMWVNNFSKSAAAPAVKPDAPSYPPQQFFKARLKKELQLTADQTNRLDAIFTESNLRRAQISSLIEPEMKKERQAVHEEIRAVLTPEQRNKFEELLKQPPPHRPDGGRRGRTNQTNNANIPAK